MVSIRERLVVIPRSEQVNGANDAFDILSNHGLVYLAWEERTGKTLTSILLAEKCPTIEKVLIITKKKALNDWNKTLKSYPHNKIYTVTNYHGASKIKGKYDFVILDEAHSYISGYPKRSVMWHDISKLCTGLPMVFISATPHAQGYQLLYNQFALSSYSPWKHHKEFYSWFKQYAILVDGQLPVKRISPVRSVIDYTKLNDSKVLQDISHLFLTKTRKELDFDQEPTDKLHYIELSKPIKDIYNDLIKTKLLQFTHGETGKEYLLVCDTPLKLRCILHMLEGGTLKIDNDYINLSNNEKVNYILETWGDTKDLVIMYNYIADRIKLEKYFKNATILQGTSYAEGIDLSAYKHLVIYSQDFSTAKHTQRRARQANKERVEDIIVHYLLVKNAVSDKAYKTVSINKKNYVDTVFERI